MLDDAEQRVERLREERDTALDMFQGAALMLGLPTRLAAMPVLGGYAATAKVTNCACV